MIAFEPSPFNLEILTRNIALNDLDEWVSVVPLALSNRSGPAILRISSTDRGEGSNALLSRSEIHDGGGTEGVPFSTFGVTANRVTEVLNVPLPTHIKLDVDGNEGRILEGATRVLSTVEGILVGGVA